MSRKSNSTTIFILKMTFFLGQCSFLISGRQQQLKSSGSMVYLIRFSFLFSNFLGGVTRTHCGLGFDHVLRTLAAAAVLHGVAGLLVEDDAEEEDEGALEGGEQVGEGGQQDKKPGNPPSKLLH